MDKNMIGMCGVYCGTTSCRIEDGEEMTWSKPDHRTKADSPRFASRRATLSESAGRRKKKKKKNIMLDGTLSEMANLAGISGLGFLKALFDKRLRKEDSV
jgi:hypothetical protein